MEETKYHALSPSPQRRGLQQPPLEKAAYSQENVIALPSPAGNGISLWEAVDGRRSIRKYSKTPLDLIQLSFLLWTTQGVKEMTPSATFRTVPSAGARHALETYLLVNRVGGLNPGLYRYLALSHQLLTLQSEETLAQEITRGCFGQTMVRESAVTFIWSAVPYRMTWRYSERGYRYLHLDAGHVCQNLYLGAEAIQAGVCAIAAFHDDALNSLLGFDGENEFVIYLATVGKKVV